MAEAGVPVDLRQLGSLIHGFANFNALGGGCSRGIADMVSALTAHLRRG
jgi:acetyl esterase